MDTGDKLVTLDELKLVNDRVKPVSEGGSGLDQSPSLLVNLASNNAANVMQASPRPGVTGVLGTSNGGSGMNASPSMLVNLASTNAANVMQASPRPGVTGVLGIPNGGTGMSASPSMLVNLASTNAANVMQASPCPGVTGVLPFANGGTAGNFTIKSFSVSDLSADKTIIEMGLIENGSSYLIVLSRMQGTAQDISSVYTVRVVNDTFYLQSAIHEGTYGSAPILQSNGVIKKQSGAAFTSNDSYRGIALRFGA